MFWDRVQAGLSLLTDEQIRALNVDALDMGSPCQCVLGQLYGEFLTGAIALKLSYTQMILYGFELPSNKYQHINVLRDEWRSAIRKAQEER